MKNYLDNRKQRVILNGQHLSWIIIPPGVPQSSTLGSLLIHIYINDLPDGLISIYEIFADGRSIFSEVFVKYKFQRDLNNDLFIISE